MRQEVWGWGINLFERSHQSNYTTNTVERWIPYRGWIKKNSEKEREKELKKENIIRIVVNIPIQLEVESGLSVRPLIEDQTMLAFFLVHFACYVMHTHICFPYDAVVLSNFHVFYTLLWFGILFMAHPCTSMSDACVYSSFALEYITLYFYARKQLSYWFFIFCFSSLYFRCGRFVYCNIYDVYIEWEYHLMFVHIDRNELLVGFCLWM